MQPTPGARWMWWLIVLAGCQHFNFDMLRSQNADNEEPLDAEFQTKVETPLVGEYTRAAGLHVITLQGVGLVTGLDGTGGNPPPSHLRTLLVDEMRKRGVKNPNAILASPSTAMVMVRAYLPPLVEKGDRFDVEVWLPGSSDGTSLSGGWLMETVLTEQAIVPGRGVMNGHVFAKARGPILITGRPSKEGPSEALRRGRVLGGGESLRERHMALYLRNDFRSFRNSRRIAESIGNRFHHYNKHGLLEPLAEAKTDQKIDLQLLPKYKDNYPRFLQVVRNIAFRESAAARRVRMQQLGERLLVPQTAELAALQLEAIGVEAIPLLKAGLKSPSLEVRFHAATALAYLDEPAGLPALAEAAKKEPAFRVFALAALAAVDEADSHLLLRELIDESSAETRYGAFRALTTLNPHDPYVRGERLGDGFMLHVLQTQAEPMIHLTHRKKAEIVLFGADQRLKTPLVVRAGNRVLVTATNGSQEVTVSRYALDQPPQSKVVSTLVADVIRAAVELGATYPDIAQMLVQADRQHNTPGPIQIDALPRAGRFYRRAEAELSGGYEPQTRVGTDRLVPNLFDIEHSGEPESAVDQEIDAAAVEELDAPQTPELSSDDPSRMPEDEPATSPPGAVTGDSPGSAAATRPPADQRSTAAPRSADRKTESPLMRLFGGWQ